MFNFFSRTGDSLRVLKTTITYGLFAFGGLAITVYMSPTFIQAYSLSQLFAQKKLEEKQVRSSVVN
jgi:hypothetical protein